MLLVCVQMRLWRSSLSRGRRNDNDSEADDANRLGYVGSGDPFNAPDDPTMWYEGRQAVS
jgi:hypothetical protein